MNLYSILENIVKLLHLHDDFNAQLLKYYKIKNAGKENEYMKKFLTKGQTIQK